MIDESVKKLSVVILSRNEENNIEKVIRDVIAGVASPMEVLVIDDSDDCTAAIVNQLSLSQAAIRLIAQEGKGYTSAIATGVKYAKGDALVVLVGDSSDEIADIARMREKMNEGYDIVCGSRYMKGGSRERSNFLQSALSFLVCKSLSLFLGIQTCDVSNSFKMYRKSIFESLELADSGYATTMQITLKAFFNRKRIAEIPTTWRNRSSGSSKFSFGVQGRHYAYWYLWAIVRGLGLSVPRRVKWK